MTDMQNTDEIYDSVIKDLYFNTISNDTILNVNNIIDNLDFQDAWLILSLVNPLGIQNKSEHQSKTEIHKTIINKHPELLSVIMNSPALNKNFLKFYWQNFNDLIRDNKQTHWKLNDSIKESKTTYLFNMLYYGNEQVLKSILALINPLIKNGKLNCIRDIIEAKDRKGISKKDITAFDKALALHKPEHIADAVNHLIKEKTKSSIQKVADLEKILLLAEKPKTLKNKPGIKM